MSSAAAYEDTGNDNMKRAAAAQLIQHYFYQLTTGCGLPNCSNTYCASSPSFVYGKPLERDKAAIETIKLTKTKAPLCEHLRLSVSVQEVGENQLPSPSSDLDLEKDETADSSSMGAACYKSAKKGGSTKSGRLPSVSMSENGGIVCSESLVNVRPSSSSSSIQLPDDWFKHGLLKEKLIDVCSSCHATGKWLTLSRLIRVAFGDADALISNFITPLQKEVVRSMEVDADKDVDDSEEHSERGSYLGISAARLSVMPDPVVHIDSVRSCFAYLFDIDKHFGLSELPFISDLKTAVEAMTAGLVRRSTSSETSLLVNVIFILMELPMDTVAELSDSVLPCICRMAEHLPVDMQARLVKLWAENCDATRLRDMVHTVQQYITMQVLMTSWSRDVLVNDDPKITSAAKLLKILFYASVLGGRVDTPAVRQAEKQHAIESMIVRETLHDLLQRLDDGASAIDRDDRAKKEEDVLERELGISRLDCREPLVPLRDFINEPLSDVIEMDKDYLYYRTEAADNKFTFMLHPFMLTTLTKNMAMYFDNRIRMLQERRQSFIQTFIGGQISLPHLRLHIRRDHIIDDALAALEVAALENPDDLKKQLYIEFDGEQGIDEGGLSKEFFQLVIEELFKPDYGMFVWSEEAKAFWFNAMSFENESQFSLVGILLGLAIYNNVILDVRFPMVVYRKLLGKLGTFDDLHLSHPVLARGLKQMLEYEGEDFGDVFEQTFCISYLDIFGNSLSQDLKSNGADIPVTKDNRHEFVELYADFLLNTSVASQFLAFRRGFRLVTDESPLRLLFRPDEVEQLICGSRQYDFRALESGTTYDGGFSADSDTIRHFWDVVHNSFNDEQRRKFLEFVTGSDRAPLGGLAKLRLVIARHGPDSDRLPTAHTCYNVLLMPDYNNRDKLHDLLHKAINYAKGFGML